MSIEDLSPKTRQLIAEMEAVVPLLKTTEFTRYAEGLFGASACTSLSDEDALARMNLAPSGTSGGWQMSEQTEFPTGEPHPCPCEDKPDTHRHIYFEC